MTFLDEILEVFVIINIMSITNHFSILGPNGINSCHIPSCSDPQQ